MNREVLINAGAGEFRVAVVEDGRLQDFTLERTIGLEDGPVKKSGRSGHSLIGNIILGRVQRVLPGMQAAFVDIGRDKAGFLGAREWAIQGLAAVTVALLCNAIRNEWDLVTWIAPRADEKKPEP